MNGRLGALAESRQSVWLDCIDPTLLAGANLQRLIDAGVNAPATRAKCPARAAD